MLDKLWAIGRVLTAGEELANASTWKNRQASANAVLAVLGGALAFLPPELAIEQTDLQMVAAGVATLGGVLNAYFTLAADRRVGLSAHRQSGQRHPHRLHDSDRRTRDEDAL
jgi:hypothetical protein